MDALVEAIKDGVGSVHLNSPAQKVMVEDVHVAGVRTFATFVPADHVISTIPMPNVPAIITDLPGELELLVQCYGMNSGLPTQAPRHAGAGAIRLEWATHPLWTSAFHGALRNSG